MSLGGWRRASSGEEGGQEDSYRFVVLSNHRDSLGPRNQPALWRSGTKATSVAILLVWAADREQRTGTSCTILARAVRWTRVAALALRMLDMPI